MDRKVFNKASERQITLKTKKALISCRREKKRKRKSCHVNQLKLRQLRVWFLVPVTVTDSERFQKCKKKMANRASEYAQKAIQFADAQCMPIGLIVGLIFGLLVPVVGTTIGQEGVMSYICVVVIFFISGLKLNTQEAKAAMGSHKSILYGITSIMVITSLLGSFLTTFVPLEPAEFKNGITIFFCTPCAIAYSVILTKSVSLVKENS